MRFEPNWRAFGALSLIVVSMSACGRRSTAHLPAAPRIGATETGEASWYGNPYHGRRTASGEVFDMEAMTAAHRTLPFDTWVRVDNLDNGKRAEVRVTDRGPFVKNRIIDLSRAAAQDIGMIGPGVARVKLTVIRPPSEFAAAKRSADAPPAPPIPPRTTEARFGVQVGAFDNRSRADHLRRDLQLRFGAASSVRRDGDPPLWRVIVGNESSLDTAEETASRLRAEFPNAAVVRIDNPR